MNSISKSITLICLLTLTFTAQAKIFRATVTDVIDGDTFYVLDGTDQIKVRLRGIDAPELDQDYGQMAKEILSHKVLNKKVLVLTDMNDVYGRTLASVAVDGSDVGLEMLEDGAAWVYKRYDNSVPMDWRNAYYMAESYAKSDFFGLWQMDGAVPPWSWRKQKREAQRNLEDMHSQSLQGLEENLRTDLNVLNNRLDTLSVDLFNDEEKEPAEFGKEKVGFWESAFLFAETLSRYLKAYFSSLL